MNPDQILALGRQLLVLFAGAAGTYLVTHGYVTSAQWASLSGALGSIASIVLTTVAPIAITVWSSLHANSHAGKLESVARIPDVVRVQMAPTAEGDRLAAVTPSSKVTT